jgi:hypothetical protein
MYVQQKKPCSFTSGKTKWPAAKIPALFGIGILLLIISGVTMMGITDGVFGEQIWFRIKFVLVLLIIVNGLAVGRGQGVRLRKILSGEKPGGYVEERILKIKRNLSLFHIAQLSLFFAIFVLSVFKFN